MKFKPESIDKPLKNRVLRMSGMVGVTIFFIAVFSGIFFSSLYFHRQSSSTLGYTNGDTTKTYKFLKYNPVTEDSSLGFVSMADELKSDEFVSYEDDNKNLYLISNFGGKSFICSGSCSCREEQRRTSATLTLPILLLISALAAGTVLTTLDSAKSKFDEECRSRMMNEEGCSPEHAIESKVDNCEELSDDKSNFDEYGRDFRTFSCEIWCAHERVGISRVRSCEYGHSEEVTKTHQALEEECARIRMKGEVKVDCETVLRNKVTESCTYYAMKTFREEYEAEMSFLCHYDEETDSYRKCVYNPHGCLLCQQTSPKPSVTTEGEKKRN